MAIAALGFALRAFPLAQAGAFGYPVDYDEGVYFASSSLLLHGTLPYRDFVFVHPPSLLYCLFPATWLGLVSDPSIGFAAARWMFAAIGTVNVLLVGRLGMRLAGGVGALAAALIYASHPVAVATERGPFLEPILNLVCLCLGSVWLAQENGKRSRAVAAGVLCGAAISVKLVGVVWLVACAVSAWRGMRQRWPAFLGAAAVTAGALVGLVALRAPGAFFRQAISFQLHRPADGTISLVDRAAAMLWLDGQLPKSLLVLGGLVLAARRWREPARRGERFFAAALLCIAAAFLLSSSYWSQYNAHLAVPEAVLAAYAAGALCSWRGWERTGAGLAVAALGLAAFLGARRAVLIGRSRSSEVPALASFLRSTVSSGARAVSLEPAWLLAAGRLPSPAGGHLIVDPYASMLIAATSEGRRFSTATQAFADPSSQVGISAALRASRYAILGARGHWQLANATQQWLGAHFVQKFPPPRQEGIDVWERAR